MMFVLATLYRPPGHHTDFIKVFGDFLSELVLAADKVLTVGNCNIHFDNEKDAIGSAFIDILNSIGVRLHVSGPTNCRDHTLDLILSHGIDVNGVAILQQSDDTSDHYLVLCKFHIAKAVNSTSCYKYRRTITLSRIWSPLTTLQLHITHGLQLPSCTALRRTHFHPPLHQLHSCH